MIDALRQAVGSDDRLLALVDESLLGDSAAYEPTDRAAGPP